MVKVITKKIPPYDNNYHWIIVTYIFDKNDFNHKKITTSCEMTKVNLITKLYFC